MRTNDDIIVNYESYGGNVSETLFDWETCDSAMKEAQVEALKELQKREVYWLRSGSSESESIYGSIRDTISSLIKEIEG